MRRVALAFLVLPLALAACSASQYRAARALAPAASVQQAAKKTTAAATFHTTLNTFASYGAIQTSVQGSGDFDNANQRGSFHLDVSSYGSVDAILDGTSAYVKAPFLASFLPAGKTWLKLDTAARGAVPPVVPQNPRQLLAKLKKLAHVRKVGDATIDGVSATRYHGIARLGHATFDVWVGNADGYVRRIETALGGSDARVKLVAAFSDFGKAVDVAAPPASETADAGNLVPFFRGG